MKMVKIMRTVMIEQEIYNKARAAGLNLSIESENGLRHALLRIDGTTKTIEELAIERDIKERQRKVKEAQIEMEKAQAAAEGRMYVDEKSPMLINVKTFTKRK